MKTSLIFNTPMWHARDATRVVVSRQSCLTYQAGLLNLEVAVDARCSSNALTGRRLLAVKFHVSYALDKSLHPRTLRLLLCKLPVEFCMRLSIDPVFGCPVRLSFVAVIKPMTV